MAVDIKPVRSRLARHKFVDFPFRLFKHDPAWVPPLRMSVLDRISPKYPANDHQDTALWMAYRDGKPVGRIGACVDHKFNEFQDQSWAWVGFFEAFDDPEVADALFDTACRWASANGVEECVGPASFTTNDECGLLVEGFEHPPMVLTPQNPRYYEHLWVDTGWEPAMDLWGWSVDKQSATLSDRQRRALERLKARGDIELRSMRMQDFDAEVDRFFEVYHSAWARNWGFAPMTQPEIKHLAKNLKQILDPDLALFAEKQGKPVGVALVLPDANEPMLRVRSGRLLPTGWWTLLRGLKRTSGVRVFALGVQAERQSRAIGPLLYAELLDRAGRKDNITRAEASWILATNTAMNRAIETAGCERYKTWRMYRRKALPV
jgi:GNAT superfamily N-acetyltransferase